MFAIVRDQSPNLYCKELHALLDQVKPGREIVINRDDHTCVFWNSFSCLFFLRGTDSQLVYFPPNAMAERSFGNNHIAQSDGDVEYTDCTSANKCPAYDTKQSDGKVPVMLELWGMRSTPSLPLLPGPL